MPDNKLKMLCLGDSYTIGEAVELKDGFPLQTVKLLEDSGIVFKEPHIIAKTGWTTDELRTAIVEAHVKSKFDVVTLLIGVNNQYRGRDLINYRAEFTELLNTALEYADNRPERVFVLSIPDWGVTPFGQADKRGEARIGEEIDAFNEAAKQVSKMHKVHFVDITAISRKAKTEASLTAEDKLHPSKKMYAEWARKLAPKMARVLSR